MSSGRTWQPMISVFLPNDPDHRPKAWACRLSDVVMSRDVVGPPTTIVHQFVDGVPDVGIFGSSAEMTVFVVVVCVFKACSFGPLCPPT